MATTDCGQAVILPARASPLQEKPPTLLPSPVARAVSLATRSTGLAVRLASFVGSCSLDAARFTTLSSLELARGMVGHVLILAGDDIASRSRSRIAASDAETLLERNMETLHTAVAQIVFWTSASFQFTNTTLGLATEASQQLLSTLDQLFGSTDSSRAVASIVTLIRREFHNPDTGNQVDRVGVVDLILALSALAYLQHRCRRSPADERRRQATEELVWDVVVLDDGERIDVDEGEELLLVPQSRDSVAERSNSTAQPGSSWALTDDDEQAVSLLRSHMSASLPKGTSVSISNSVSSVQTITVDIDGPELVPIPTPPGAEVVAIHSQPPDSQHIAQHSAQRRVVYKIERNKCKTVAFRQGEDHGGSAVVESGTREQPNPGSMERLPLSPLSPNQDPGLRDNGQSKVEELPQSATEEAHRVASCLKTSEPPVSSAASPRPGSSQDSRHTANQGKQRSLMRSSGSQEKLQKQRPDSVGGKKAAVKKKADSSVSTKSSLDRKGSIKQAIRGGGQSLSNILNNKENTTSGSSSSSSSQKPQWKSPGTTPPSDRSGKSKPLVQRRRDASPRGTPTPRAPQQNAEFIPRSSSRASYVSYQERRRDSIVSQTDSYPIHSSSGRRPSSPGLRLGKTDGGTVDHVSGVGAASHWASQHRNASYAPSLYSLATNDSQASLVLSSYYQKSAYSNSGALGTLRREGFVDGTFPSGHLLQNITRYMRYSSASYGSHFLKYMGISKTVPRGGENQSVTHHDLQHFVHHTRSEADSILLASFFDPENESDSAGSPESGLPLVHYISLDHEAKAVILACRGTLGFEDVLTDMTCDYDTLTWRGRAYKVHKGMHASARRLLVGGDGRVLVTIREALQEFPDYGLVLCGHSLGAAVTSLLGVMLSEPNPCGSGFVTTYDAHYGTAPGSATAEPALSAIRLPAGRRIHVYAYGPPGVMTRSLSKNTRGLITSVVQGNDLVPHLSLGLLHDLQAMAASFKKDENQAKAEIRRRMWGALRGNLADKWYGSSSARASNDEEEEWMLPALDALRANMNHKKLIPPGEVFAVETQQVLRRDAFLRVEEERIGRPAQRIVLKYIKDVDRRFGEVRFGASMLIDHSPAKYEEALNRLRLGVGG